MDHLQRSLLNTYSGQPLDRAAHGRKQLHWLEQQAVHPDAQYLLLHNEQVITQGNQPLFLNQLQYQQLQGTSQAVLLGLNTASPECVYPVYMLNLEQPECELSVVNDKPASLCELQALRQLTPHLSDTMAALCAYALILNHWHQTTQFCTRCGSALVKIEGGVAQQCCNDACAHIEFPRINAAVIMRVTHQDKILLARQESWPEHRYSVLAGFVEVGESLEMAVQREVMEEVSILVENIHYHSSQPWPFPNSLMLGYTAEAQQTTLGLEQDDIAEALWLTAKELQEKMLEGSVMPPPDLSISYRLIDDWFYQQCGQHLHEFQSKKPWFVEPS